MQAPGIENDRSDRLTVLERIAAGEKSAVEECISVYGALVWKIARRHSINSDDAEDAVQEIFTSIWMNAHRFTATKSPEAAFICLLARRKAIDLFRRQKMRMFETDVVEAERRLKTENDNFRNVLLGMDLKAIKQALKNLPTAENEFIRLSIYDGSSHNEIAERFNLPLGTVKSKIRRGMNKIRSSVGEPFLNDLREAYF